MNLNTVVATSGENANEQFNRIKNGWRSAEELRELYEFLERVEMASDAELEKLCDSGYTNLIYDAYQPESVERPA